jgi:hypothetical protein
LLAFDVFETDYFTSQFAKHLYKSRAEHFTIDPGSDFSSFNRLLCSFGFNLLLFAAGKKTPSLILSTRSANVANAAATAGLHHVSMNEGVSQSDRYAPEFDAAATIFRGLKEELGLNRADIARVDLYEPFLELNNCEVGQFATAYTTLSDETVLARVKRASDALLESANLFAIEATAASIGRFIAADAPRTNLLAYCLGSAVQHELF